MELDNILVVNDTLDGLGSATAKAAEVEHYTGAAIEIAEIIYDTIAEESTDVLPQVEQARMIERLKAAERNGLQNVAAPFERKVASLSTRVIWNKDRLAGALQAARECRAGLIVKPAAEHHLLGDFVHLPLDWGLMREATCPVLVTKERPWPDRRRVLAAVDIADRAHESLNRDILTTAASWADLMDGELHVVSVYPSLGQEISEYQVATDFEGLKTEMKKSRDAEIGLLIESLGVTVAGIHTVAGSPHVVIATLADELEAAVTVVGTAARTGVKKLVFGNTAERIISHLKSDILTLK